MKSSLFDVFIIFVFLHVLEPEPWGIRVTNRIT